jgi:DNA-binding SARP family transcriptional activator
VAQVALQSAPSEGSLTLLAGDPTRGAQLRLLRGFDVTLGGEPLSIPLSAQRLLAFLALQDHPTRRGVIAMTMWPDTTEERACANLRSVLWRLRGIAPDFVVSVGDALALPSSLFVDVKAAVAMANDILQRPLEAERVPLYQRYLSADLLPQWYDDWVLMERERFRQLRLRALEGLADKLIVAARFAEAMDAALAAVSVEPLRESAHRAVIRVHLAEGNYSEALREYDGYRRMLGDELDVEPSPQLTDTIRTVTGGGQRPRFA